MKPETESFDHVVQEIREFFEQRPDFASLRDNDAFMEIAVPAMSRLLGLGKIVVSIRRPSGRWYPKRFAPHLGLMVRMLKLYEGILEETCQQKGDLVTVFYRPFFETLVKLEYLMRSGPKTVRSFIETSFRPEKDMLAHLKGVGCRRKLTPIEQRMLKSIQSHLRRAGIRQKDLLARKTWDLDGRNMRSLLGTMNWDIGYAFGFGSSSHWVHPSWYDLLTNHLSFERGQYSPDITYRIPDTRLVAPHSYMLANRLLRFATYFKLEPRRLLEEILTMIAIFFHDLDAAHEEVLSGGSRSEAS